MCKYVHGLWLYIVAVDGSLRLGHAFCSCTSSEGSITMLIPCQGSCDDWVLERSMSVPLQQKPVMQQARVLDMCNLHIPITPKSPSSLPLRLKRLWTYHKYGPGHILSFLIEKGNRVYFFLSFFLCFLFLWFLFLFLQPEALELKFQFFLLLESSKDHKVKVPDLSFHGMQVIITTVPCFQVSAQK